MRRFCTSHRKILCNYYRGVSPTSGVPVASGATPCGLAPTAASGLMDFGLVPTVASGLMDFGLVPTAASGSTDLTESGLTDFGLVPIPTLEGTVLARVPIPMAPACPAFEPMPVTLGKGLAAAGPILAFPAAPIGRPIPRCAKHMPVSKPSNMPQRITFLILSSADRCLVRPVNEGLPI